MGAGMIRFDNSWMRDLPGTFLRQDPDPAPQPRLLAWNAGLAADLGLDPQVKTEAAAWFSGAALPPGAEPVALAYVDAALAANRTRVNALVRGKPVPMEVAPLPFVPNRYYRG